MEQSDIITPPPFPPLSRWVELLSVVLKSLEAGDISAWFYRMGQEATGGGFCLAKCIISLGHKAANSALHTSQSAQGPAWTPNKRAHCPTNPSRLQSYQTTTGQQLRFSFTLFYPRHIVVYKIITILYSLFVTLD